MKINVNNRAIVAYTNTLENMHRSALPNTVRNTLNNAVYDVKTNTMPNSANDTFKKRSPNFFKSQSRFENAKGFNVSSMKATVGFVTNGLKDGASNFSVNDLEKQEHGGALDKKSFIPLDSARVGSSYGKNVRNANRLSAITKIVKARNQRGKTKAEKFVVAIIKAGVGGFVLGSEFKGNNILFKVRSINSNIKSKKLQYKLTPLYDFQKGRKVKVKATNFMEDASLKSANKMNIYFINNARKQFDKLRK